MVPEYQTLHEMCQWSNETTLFITTEIGRIAEKNRCKKGAGRQVGHSKGFLLSFSPHLLLGISSLGNKQPYNRALHVSPRPLPRTLVLLALSWEAASTGLCLGTLAHRASAVLSHSHPSYHLLHMCCHPLFLQMRREWLRCSVCPGSCNWQMSEPGPMTQCPFNLSVLLSCQDFWGWAPVSTDDC